ncbi:UNVERIFIED_CONTAM: RNA-dependent RNA polymerase 6 [Sesamum angustifolium]|uniref:RNA-dependent RNA polymerase 6 n=1 Tax=Sesamum angustifolium TaxID=2727405 RepID=A0AAW2MJ83_9LAMI
MLFLRILVNMGLWMRSASNWRSLQQPPLISLIVNMPAELKPRTYPDFMGKEEFQSYNSRKMKDAYDKDHDASPEHTFASDDIIYDQELEVTGSTSFIADAWNCKCLYDGQLIGLLGQYKVNREEEVVRAHMVHAKVE